MWELQQARVIDLSQPWFVGMPHYPTHPPFLYSLTKLHGESMWGERNSSAADAIAMGTHVGTHIDALNHFSCDGRLFNGALAAKHQSYEKGVRELAVDTLGPIVRRGVLFDLAAGGPLAEDFEVRPEHLAACGVEPRGGDVALIRTGWARFWNDPGRYINRLRTPGPGLEAARWLSERGVFAAGSDTAAFERVPSPEMAVHVHLLVESGIHIIEALNLEELAGAGVREFLFIAAPLKIQGATGSPVRPFALVME